MMDNMDPALIEQMLRMGEDDPEAPALKRQQAMVNRLRDQSMQGLPISETGGTRTVAPNWGQAASQLASHYRANQMESELDKGTRAMGDRSVSARKDYMGALSRALGRPRPQPGMMPAPTGQAMSPTIGPYDE